MITRSFHYQVIQSDRVLGPKFETKETVVAEGLPWNKAKQKRDELQQRVTAAARPGETSWTLPVFYCHQEPQLEFEEVFGV
jgi:hypothetical protein